MTPSPIFTLNANSGSGMSLQDKVCAKLEYLNGAISYGQRVGSGICESWPTYLKSPLAWNHLTFRKEADFIYTLSDNEITEAENALAHFKGLRLDGKEVNCHNFPLPTLSQRLQLMVLEIHQGRGFIVLRGLNPNDYSTEDNALLFLGISSYIGERRGQQDSNGSMFGHIKEAKCSKTSQQNRPNADSNLAVKFHTDMFTDIVALQTRSCAAKGGEHLIASTWNLYNELAASRPDLISVLASSDWGFDIRNCIAEPRIRPLLYFHAGRVLFNFSRHPLEGSKGLIRAADLPIVTEVQREALDVIQAIAERHQVTLRMRRGDLTYINNFAMLHSRTAFQDDELNSRYLVLLWLKNERLAWKLPRPLQLGNRTVFYDRKVDEDWNVIPIPKLNFPLHERLTP